jgi:hypothetical protein
VTSCGSTSVTAVSPAHATGAVTVTLTNSGGTASNGLTYTYVDTTKPVFTAMTVSGNQVGVTFSEPVCRAAAWTTNDWSINNISNPGSLADTGDNIPVCTAAFDNAVTSGVIILGVPAPNGAFVETTINETVIADGTGSNVRIVDTSSNPIAAPQSRQATATAPETTPPTITAVTGAVGTTTITITFSEPVYCTGLSYDSTDFTLTDNNSATIDPSIVAAGSNLCGSSQATADTSFTVTTNAALPSATTYTLTLTPEANEIQDIAGNDLATPTSVTFTTGAADFTPPTMIDARLVNNAGPSTDFVETGDSFSITFSEVMNTTVGTISIQDQDGTTATMNCSAGTTCSWNAAATVLTVTLGATLANNAGTTPGMQIPFNITALTNVTDTSGNPPNVLGSSDRLVDYE